MNICATPIKASGLLRCPLPKSFVLFPLVPRKGIGCPLKTDFTTVTHAPGRKSGLPRTLDEMNSGLLPSLVVWPYSGYTKTTISTMDQLAGSLHSNPRIIYSLPLGRFWTGLMLECSLYSHRTVTNTKTQPLNALDSDERVRITYNTTVTKATENGDSDFSYSRFLLTSNAKPRHENGKTADIYGKCI